MDRVAGRPAPLIALALAACDGPARALASLEGAWDCVDEAAEAESFVLVREPPSLALEAIDLVGAEDDPQVPAGTVCRYRQASTTFEVEEGSAFAWRLAYRVDAVELVDDPANTGACATWAARENALAVVDLRDDFEFDRPDEDALETSERTCVRE